MELYEVPEPEDNAVEFFQRHIRSRFLEYALYLGVQFFWVYPRQRRHLLYDLVNTPSSRFYRLRRRHW